MKYEFFVAGRWRNKKAIREVLEAIRKADRTAYCFIENIYYEGKSATLSFDVDTEKTMQTLEKLSAGDPLVKEIFDTDMNAQKRSEKFVLVLPAGISGHVEAGVAYGMGMKCYAIGKPEKTETLYKIFDKVFADLDEFKNWLSE